MSSTRAYSLMIVILMILSSMSMFNASPSEICRFDSMYQLGDSSTTKLDLLARSALLFDIPSYNGSSYTDGNFGNGVNFGVSGSTSLPHDLLANHNIFPPATASSLPVQLQWMSNYFQSLCLENKDCGVKIQNSLFVVGEMGGNDYMYAFLQGKSMDEVKDLMVPQVVDNIIQAVKKVVSFGATRVMVPGNLQIGCLPVYKTAFKTNNSESYDEHYCLKEFNEFAKYHNEQLQEALDFLRQETPEAIIFYGDYYNAYEFLLKFAKDVYGGYMDTQKACCGIGGDYNFNISRMCGSDPEVPVCSDSYWYMHWDGIHLTGDQYDSMSGWMISHHFFQELGLWCIY